MIFYCILIANVRLVARTAEIVTTGLGGILQLYAVAPGSQTEEWRYVCNDFFDTNSTGTQVACKELGYNAGTQDHATVKGDWVYWDNVQCIGSEKSLADCKRPDPGYCGPSEAVKLTCTGTQKFIWNFLNIIYSIDLICVLLL